MKTLKTAFLLTALTLLLLASGRRSAAQRGMTIALVFAVLMNGRRVFFLGQDRAGVQRRAADQPRAVAAAVRGDGAAGGQGQLADAEAVHDSAACAERFRHGPQSQPRVGGRDARADGTDERRRTGRRDRARAFARAQLRHSDVLDCRDDRRRDHLGRARWAVGE